MANTYLSRTPSSASNQKTYTISAWFKLSSITTNNHIFGAKDPARSTHDGLWVLSSGQIMYYIEGVTVRQSTQVLRDFNAWYHVVASVDTTQSTASNRVKIYLNGSQITSFSTSADPTQNVNTAINGTNIHKVGARINDDYFDGYMSHIHFTDGTTYEPTAFGEYDANGVWKIKTDVSVTYGTNGFFILKDGNSVTDQSGNGNNFTVGGGTLTNTEDSPSNVFATLNALDFSGGALSNGNLTQTNSGECNTNGTLGMVNGKYYWEVKMVSAFGGVIGIGDGTAKLGTALSNLAKIYGYSPNGNKYENATGTSYGATYTTGDIIGIAFDADTRELEFYKNGVSQGVAFTVDDGFTYLPQFHLNNSSVDVNFGNGYFGTTAVASAGTNASGNGIFEYDVPTGYTALSTKGLNL